MEIELEFGDSGVVHGIGVIRNGCVRSWKWDLVRHLGSDMRVVQFTKQELFSGLYGFYCVICSDYPDT